MVVSMFPAQALSLQNEPEESPDSLATSMDSDLTESGETVAQSDELSPDEDDALSGNVAERSEDANETGEEVNTHLLTAQTQEQDADLSSEAAQDFPETVSEEVSFDNAALLDATTYEISTVAELVAISNDLAGLYYLQNDLDLSSYGNWTPIGEGTGTFSGLFDGQGHTIRGLTISDASYSNSGLFGTVSGTVKNLNVSGTISGAKTAGGIVSVINGGTLDRCSFSGSVAGENDVGGLVGYVMNGTVRNAYSTAKVTNTNTSTSAENGCGGLVGDLYGSGASASIISSYATGEVMKTSTADGSGGLVGYTHTYWGGSTAITNCYFDNYNNSAADKGTYKTSSEMKQKSTYAGWDFDDIWSISASVNNGYPTLTHVPLTENTSVSGVSLNKSRLDLQIGNTGVLIATVRPLNASNKNVRWETSSGAVATISDGIVTAKGKGTATITVTTVDGGHQATCTVNVSESSGSNTGTGYKDVQVPVREQNDTSVEQRILDQMNPNDLLADMSFGNDTLRGPSITIHKKTFYLFEMEMNANIKITDKVSIQVKVDNKKKTFKVLLGYKLLKGSTAITGDPNSRDEKHDFWDSYTQAKSLYKLVSSKNTSPSVIRSKFKQQYDRLQTFQTDMLVKAEGSFSGYMELSYEKGKLDFSEGGAILGIKVNKTLSHRISAFPAAYATLKFELSAEDKIVVSKGESKPLLDMQFKAGFNTAVGLGLGKNTGIYQAYVEGGLEGVLELIATTAGLRDASTYPLSVTLSGSLYLEYKAKGLILSAGDTKKKEIGKLGLYPRLELLNAGDYVAVSMSDFLATAKPITRDYLNSVGEGASLLGVLDDYSYSKENLYPYCEPTLIAFPNGEMLMVWVDDLGEKADNERTTLVYSSYSAGKWSSVSAIHENGAYNDHPVLCQNGNSVYLIWMRADSPAQGDWDEMTMLQHMELCYATYDMSSKSFSSPVVISDTNNTLAETDYSIAANDNEVAVTWIQNSENDLFMSEGTNSIYLRTFKNGAWGDIQTLLSTEQQIASLKVTEGNNGWSAVYSLCDAEVESPDVVTYQRNNGDTSAKVLDQITESVSYVDGHSYYLRESELYCDGNSTGLTGVTNFNVVSNDRGTVILALVPTGFTCELFASYYNAGAKTWGDWIQMTAFEKYIRDYSAVLNEDGELVVALNLVDVDADATDGLYKNATLVVIKDMEYRDMVMGDTISYDDDAVVPGGELELSFEVTNNSRETLTGIAVELNVNGAKVTKNIECGIDPGMTETLFTTYVLPQSLNKFTLSLTGTPNYSASENRTDNNSATVEIGFADLTIQASQPRRENGNWIVDLEVANQGYEAAESGKVTVHGGNVSGDALSVLDVTALAVGAKTTVSYTLPESYTHSQDTDTMNALQFSLNSDTQERNYGNNEDRIVFGNLESKWSVLKESNSTIKVTCSDTSIGGQFILGVYDENGKFLKAQIQSVSQSEVAFSITEATADNVSVFWLDDDYRPLEAAVKYSLK